MDRNIENLFPELSKDGYELTSPETVSYNCIAWSIGDNTKCWWPDGIYYWPENIPCIETIDAFKMMYESFGFSVCENANLESGFEKIALYVDPITNRPKHASRQLSNGKWTSKLGQLKDITHNTPMGIKGFYYGVPYLFMKKAI